MTGNEEPSRRRHSLDDAIDRAVRDMTRVDADDEAVARVMARVRGAGRRRDASAMRVAWSMRAAAVAAAMVIVLIASYWMRRTAPQHGPASTTTAPAPQVAMKPNAPTIPPGPVPVPGVEQAARVERTAPRPQHVAHRAAPTPPANSAGTTLQAMSIVEATNSDAANADAANAEPSDEFHSDLSPRASDMAMSGIAPPPLVESPALTVEPLGMRALVVDSIDPSPIAVPSPVGPQR